MSIPQAIHISTDEPFEHLPRAPIVEAVIEIRSRATQILEESFFRSLLEPRLTGYEFLDSVFYGEVKLESGAAPAQKVSNLGWLGVRFRSADAKHIAQFKRDGFAFSRLEPYQTWAEFHSESERLWNIYRDLAQPVEIQRLGLRFINRIKLPPGEIRFEDYIQPAPSPPHGLELPFRGFVHTDTLAVPDHPYAINAIRTIQNLNGGVALILDIDVFTTQGFELDEKVIEHRLLEMRWLKNKMFFASVTDRSLEIFR